MSEPQEDQVAEASAGKPRPMVYIGPSASAFGLQQFQVFKGGIPSPHANDPVVACLFVEVERLNAARVALGREGSPEWSAYRAAVVAASKKRGA